MLLQMASFHSYFWLSNILLCIYATVFFIHSSIDEHLGGFQVLIIINSGAMDIGVHVSFQIIVFSS